MQESHGRAGSLKQLALCVKRWTRPTPSPHAADASPPCFPLPPSIPRAQRLEGSRSPASYDFSIWLVCFRYTSHFAADPLHASCIRMSSLVVFNLNMKVILKWRSVFLLRGRGDSTYNAQWLKQRERKRWRSRATRENRNGSRKRRTLASNPSTQSIWEEQEVQ